MTKKILIISHGIDGGINRVSSDLFLFINKNSENSCSIIRIGDSAESEISYPSEKEINVGYAAGKFGWLSKMFLWARAAMVVHKSVKENEFDVVVYSGIIPALFMSRLIGRRVKKSVFWEHGPQKTFQSIKRIGTSLLPTFDYMLSPAASSLDWARKCLSIKSKKFIVISNWVLWEKIPFRSLDDFRTDKLRIIVAARIDFRQKDFQTLVLAIKQTIARLSRKIVLDIYGQGPDSERLIKIVEAENLSEVIFLKGHVEDIYSRYSGYELSILPTRWEGFGLSLAESMSAHVPPISASVEGVVDVIEDKYNGFLYKAEDPTSLSEAITYYDSLSPKEKFVIAQRGRNKVLNSYDPGKQLSELSSLIAM